MTAADVDELTRTTRELMLKEIIALSAKATKRSIAMPSSSDNGNGGAVKTSGAEASLL
jgi:lysophosphatidate acyltransferase